MKRKQKENNSIDVRTCFIILYECYTKLQSYVHTVPQSSLSIKKTYIGKPKI